ncbi:MAG: FecR domain-containing protein [Myxococcota bacterium]
MRHVRGTIDAVATGKVLTGDEDARLREHLRSCEDCRSHYDITVGVLRLARGGPQAWAPGEAQRMTARAVALTGKPPDRPFPWWRLVWGGVAVAAAASILVLAWPRAPIGTVLIAGAGFTVDGKPAVKDQVVLEGAVLATADRDAAVLLEGPRGRRALLLRPRTSLKATSADQVALQSGRVRIQLKVGEPFTVGTPEGAEVSASGGVFIAERRDQGTLVAVHEGKVDVRSGLQAVTVREGQETVVDVSGQLAPARTASANALVEDRGDGSVWDAILRFLRSVVDAIGRALSGE